MLLERAQDDWRNILWLLKNSFWSFVCEELARKLLNVSRPQKLKFIEITALIPFSTATPHYTNNRLGVDPMSVHSIDEQRSQAALSF
jgi:hypothetical protein